MTDLLTDPDTRNSVVLLLPWLKALRRRLTARPVRSRLYGRRPSDFTQPALLERLEPRQLLSAAAAGNEFRVNTRTNGNQLATTEGQAGAIATDADGDFVVVWSSAGQDGSNFGVYAKQYNAAGVAQGDEFRVNTTTANSQFEATVAMDAVGDFVVTWTSVGQDGSGDGIFAQRYNAAGVVQGGEFQVNVTTTGDQKRSSVAMDADGDFIVTWTGSDGDGDGVFYRRFNAAGVAQSASDLQVNGNVLGNQRNSTVAVDADGEAVIAYTTDVSGTFEVAARRIEASSGIIGSFRVNTTTAGNQLFATVARDASGDFVVSWTSADQDSDGYGVYFQRYNAAGVAQSGETRVNTTVANNQQKSSVSMDADGDFVVSWESDGQDTDGSGIFARRYNAAGAARDVNEFKVNTFITDDQLGTSVAMDADGDFVVVWTSLGQDGSGTGVYAQRFNDTGPDDADLAGPTVTGLYAKGLGTDDDDLITPGEVLRSNVTGMVVTFSEELGGGLQVQLFRNGVDVSGLITSPAFSETNGKFQLAFTLNTPQGKGNYEFRVVNTTADLAGNFLDGANNGDATAETYTQTFVIEPQVAKGPEFRVNTFTAGDQRTNVQSPQAIATDAAGNFVVVWSSDSQDGQNFGVFGQRFNALGVAQGDEFQVNTFTTSAQDRAVVAMDAVGNFVISWDSGANQDGAGTGVFARRYNAAGAAQDANEFQVNTFTTNNQFAPSIAMDNRGNFVITWSSNLQDGNGLGVYAQRYNANGTTRGDEFRVNTTTVDRQEGSNVAMDADGDFVVTWSSLNQDGSEYGIYAKRYNADGLELSGEFKVNTTTAGTQWVPVVDLDADGDFVIAWWSQDPQDGSGYGVYAQRYNAAGVLQGDEFRVNTTTAGNQCYPRVALDADGDFVIAWQSNNQDGSGYGIYAQRYDAAGATQGSEFRVNKTTFSNQLNAAVSMLPDGSFVVAWTSVGQDGSGDGVYAQRYATDIAPVLAVTGAITYTENDAATAIDTGLTVTDIDDDTLASATVTLTSFVAGQDVLAFLNDGSTMGNIAVSTNVNGVLTLTSANSTATKAEWRTALRAVTYFNTSNNPTTTQRVVDIVVNDGNLPSNTLTSTINITSVNDAPAFTSNATLAAVAEDTANPPGATLASLFSGRVTDPDASPSVVGVAVTGNAATAAQGTWQYSTNGGTSWFAVGTVADNATALALSSSTLVRFLPVANFFGSPGALSVRALDNTFAGAFTNGGTRALLNTSTNGTPTPISGNLATVGTSITAKADAPNVSNGTTAPGTLSDALPITRNAVDGAEITHFKITNIQNGTLFKSNGTTAIAAGTFITAVEAGQGVRFKPNGGLSSPGTTFRFDVQAATSAVGDGLSTVVTANITVINSDLAGTWFINGKAAQILKNGNTLTFINEFGQSAAGRVLSTTEVIADGWNGLKGRVFANRIEWANNTVWTRTDPTPVPQLPVDWRFNGKKTHIEQHGSELFFTNEGGDVSRGRISSSTTFVAFDWNNVVGTLVNGGTRINWSNNSFWSAPSAVAAPAPPNLSGEWLINGVMTHIKQSGRDLHLVNERGEVSAATLSANNTQIVASSWPVTGQVNGNQINWSNGTRWTKANFVLPLLSHAWSVQSGRPAQLDYNNGELYLTNESGSRSRAVFLSATQIYAVAWKITGTLANNNTRLNFNNGTFWNAAPSALDQFFAMDPAPFD